MTRVRLGRLGIALVMVATTAVGCAQKEKEQIALLTKEKSQILAKNQLLQAELGKSQDRENALLTNLDDKNAQIATLQAAVAAKPTETKTTAADWEVGIAADRVTVGSDILFAAGRSKLTTAGKSALDKIVGDIRTTYAGMPIRVVGHTDSDPIKKSKKLWQDNLDLSANRAMAVTRYLISKRLDAANIETVALGASQPVAPNSSKANKARNRRVEIFVVK